MDSALEKIFFQSQPKDDESTNEDPEKQSNIEPDSSENPKQDKIQNENKSKKSEQKRHHSNCVIPIPQNVQMPSAYLIGDYNNYYQEPDENNKIIEKFIKFMYIIVPLIGLYVVYLIFSAVSKVPNKNLENLY